MTGELHLSLWAKTDQAKGHVHPLLYHLVDVGVCALHLWRVGLQKNTRRLIAEQLSLGEDESGALLAFWAALHDLGKASPVFQKKYKPALAEQKANGILHPIISAQDVPHGIISAWAIEHILPKLVSTPEAIAKKVGLAIGGHHGRWPTPGELFRSFHPAVVGEKVWEEMREKLVLELVALFNPPVCQALPEDTEEENSVLTFLSGFTSVADWLGSNKEFFPCQPEKILSNRYYMLAEHKAKQALLHLGWGRWTAPGDVLPFEAMFPGFNPRQIQSDCLDAVSSAEPPAIFILEAPTGVGKTEVALYAASNWLERTQGAGIYVAMPTMATGNQMYKRFTTFLKNVYQDDSPGAILAHSQARFVKEHLKLAMTEVPGEKDNRIDALAWFQSNKKQTLLHPFGVGTVDQALISVLQTRHFFVRLFGLTGKVVIFDEVHAYDAYMSAIFHRLLGWLKVLNVSVVILSATLPQKTRQEMLAAYSGIEQSSTQDVSYPRLTLAFGQDCKTISLPPPAERELKIEWLANRPDEVVNLLRSSLEDGGCAAVICNTVGQAQELYLHLNHSSLVDSNDLLLFHARYPPAWRQEIEKSVDGKFGPQRNQRPKRSILVATQVVEQSLDLDFDLVVSDLAPVDLLLQRAGRLHRHKENNATRPSRLQEPKLVVLQPGEKNNIPDFGASARVYKEYFLLQTLLALEGRQTLHVIAETEQLIEHVYGDSSFDDHPLVNVLREKQNEMWAEIQEDARKAGTQLIPKPRNPELLFERNASLEEDNPELHQVFQAMTRLIDPGVSLLCLHKKDGKLFLEPEGLECVEMEQNLAPQVVYKAMQYVVEVRDKRVFRLLLEQSDFQLPAKWKDIAAFRHHRLAVFVDGECEIPGSDFRLCLSRELGLSVQKRDVT